MTGGARGLGNAIAVSFAREGARGVVIVDINQATLEEGKKIVESYGTKVIPKFTFIMLLPVAGLVGEGMSTGKGLLTSCLCEVFGSASRRHEGGRRRKCGYGCCERIWED